MHTNSTDTSTKPLINDPRLSMYLGKSGQNYGPPMPGQETPTLNQLLQTQSQRFSHPSPHSGYPQHQPWTAGHRPMTHPGYHSHPGMYPPTHPGHPAMGHPIYTRHPQYNHTQPHHEQLQERLPVPPHGQPPYNPHSPQVGMSRLPGPPLHHQRPPGDVSSPNRPQMGSNGPIAPTPSPKLEHSPQPVVQQLPTQPSQSLNKQPPTPPGQQNGQSQPPLSSSSPAVIKPGTPPVNSMAPPSAPGKDTSVSPRPLNVPPNMPQQGYPAHPGPPHHAMNPRHGMNPYAHGFPPNGYPSRHHGPPGGYPQRPGYPGPNYAHGQIHPGGYPTHHGRGPHPGFFAQHPSQYQPRTAAPPASQHAAAQAAAQVVAAAQAQGQGQHRPFHPSMPPNGLPRPGFPPHMMSPRYIGNHAHIRPLGPPNPGPTQMPHGGKPLNLPSVAQPSLAFGQSPTTVKQERTIDGPMSPASSLGDVDHSSPRPGRPPSAASSQGSETPSVTMKRTSAKNQQKLLILYEPENPNRRRFVDDLIKFHEERGQPLRGPPMFASVALDVFALYQHVKQKGGMNEVTKKKEWGEIVRLMNFPVSPSAGFTLKKQYVKFLFEFECKVEHRQIDEDEIRKIVEMSTRKGKSSRTKQKKSGYDDERSATASPGSNPPMRTPPPPIHPGPTSQAGPQPPPIVPQTNAVAPPPEHPQGPPTQIPNGPYPPGPYQQQPPFSGPPMYRQPDPSQFGPRPNWPPMNGYRPGSHPGAPFGHNPMFNRQQPFNPMSRPPRMIRAPMNQPYPPPPHRPGPYQRVPYPRGQSPYPPSPITSQPNQSPIQPQTNHHSHVRPPMQQRPHPRKHNRPRMNFPPESVEALEPTMFNRVTARGARLEIDFWKNILMPLKSGLISESTSALNILLVLSRDDSTLPQLNLNVLQGLLGAIMSHLKAVLKALFPEKSNQIGKKRKHEAIAKKQQIKDEPETEENIYKINFKQVQSSKLNSRLISKRKVKIRKSHPRLSLLPAGEYPAIETKDDYDFDHTEHILLPIETEKLEYKNRRGKWHEPLFSPPKSSNYLINGKEYDKDCDKITLTPRQIEEIDDLEFHFSKGNEKRRRYNEIESEEEEEYESDFFDLCEETVLNPISEPKILLSRLHCLFAIIRNLSFLPANWLVLSKETELMEIITIFIHKERLVRRKMSRHANFAPPERFYLADTETPKETIEWLREIEPYWEKFFGSYTLLECSSILSYENSWRRELLEELSEDCMIVFNNLSLEVNMMYIEKAEIIINLLLNLVAARASQNDLPLTPDRPDPLDTYRLALETLVRLCTRDDNVDLILATRSFKRQQKIVRLLFENIQQDYCLILKELSITLLKQLILPQSPLTQYAAKIENSVKSLILFIENQNPDSSIHTRRLACEILVSMSCDRCNHSSLIQYEGKLADMFGNSIFHPDILTKLADCLFQLTT